MPTLKELAMDLAVATLIADVIKERRDILREQLQAMLIETGSDSTRASILDEDSEQRIAKVSLVSGSNKAYVLAEHEFTQWVKGEYPTEVIETVRDTFKTILLSKCVPSPSGAAHGETGEIVNGVSFKAGSTYVSTRFEKDGRAELARAIAQGRVVALLTQLMETPQIETGN